MEIKLNISRNVFLDKYFDDLYDYKNRFLVLYGGAGSGKSFYAAQKILVKSLMDKRKTVIIRKFGTTIKDSTFTLVTETLKKWKIYQYCKVNLSNYSIILPNDSVVLFKSIDDPEKIKSIADITDIWIEEATELTEDDFTQLDLRMRARVKNSQIILSFNPVSKANWVYKRWFSEDPNMENTKIIHSTYKDNDFLPEAYVTSLEEKIKSNPTYYRIYALGEFCSLDKLIYNNWKIETFNHNDIVGQLLVGLDFGFSNDPSALVASILDEENKKLWLFREWGDTNKTNNELADIIKSLGFSKSVIIADSAEPKSVEELRRSGIGRIKASVKGKDSILHGIQKIQQYELIVHPSCTGVITELQNYAWEKDRKSGEYINKPIDTFNHYLDALRYSLQSADKGKLRTINKSLLGI